MASRSTQTDLNPLDDHTLANITSIPPQIPDHNPFRSLLAQNAVHVNDLFAAATVAVGIVSVLDASAVPTVDVGVGTSSNSNSSISSTIAGPAVIASSSHDPTSATPNTETIDEPTPLPDIAMSVSESGLDSSGSIQASFESHIQDQEQSDPSYPFFPKTPDQLKLLEDLIGDVHLFRNLEEKQRKILLGAMQEVHYDIDEPVMIEGADMGERFYVVGSGGLCSFKRISMDMYMDVDVDVDGDDEDEFNAAPPSYSAAPPAPAGPIDSDPGSLTNEAPDYGQQVATYTRADVFGKLPCNYETQATTTILPISLCTLWAIELPMFQLLIHNIDTTEYALRGLSAAAAAAVPDADADQMEMLSHMDGFLAYIHVLQSLSDAERTQLVAGDGDGDGGDTHFLGSREFGNGDLVIRQGEKSHELYIIDEGYAEAFGLVHDLVEQGRTTPSEGQEEVLKKYERGEFFGGMYTLQIIPRLLPWPFPIHADAIQRERNDVTDRYFSSSQNQLCWKETLALQVFEP